MTALRRNPTTAINSSPGFLQLIPLSFNPESPSHQESSFTVFANEYCVYDGRVKSTCAIYVNIYTDDHRSN